MNKTRFIAGVLLALLMGASTGTAGILRGRAFDAHTNTVIRDANITIVETGKVVATDKKGWYEFKDLPDGTYHLVATRVAYDTSDTLLVQVNGETKRDIPLIPAPWVLNDIVVTGTRSPHLLKNVPVQTEVVSRRDFQRTGSRTVADALSSAIGININEDLSGQGATIRGIQGDRVLVLVDGERAVGRVRGSIDLSQFALNNVAKIEVVKGTGSTLYGSDAMGGVINIITKNPHRDYKRWNLYADYGTNRSLNPSAEFEFGNDKFGVVLGGKMYSTDGFDLDPSTPHTNGQEATDRLNFDGTMRTDLSPRWKLTTSGRFMREERNWIESEDIDIINQFVYNDNETNYRYEGATGLQYISGDKYSMEFRVFGTLYDHTWKKIQQGTNFWLDTSETQDKFIEAAYSSNYVIGDGHVMTYGLQFNYQDLVSTELSTDKQADRSEAGYFQYEYAPIPQLTFLPGIRYEHHSSFGGHVNPSFNLMYKPNEEVKLRGFVGRGFRAPSIKEQYFIFDHSAAGYVVFGGLLGVPGVSADQFHQLKEETSINSSVSAEFSYGSIGMHRVTFFYNHLDDMIDFKLIDFSNDYWRGRYAYQNIESARTQGIEWESRVRLGQAFDFSLAYNFLDTKILASADSLEVGRELTNRPRHTLKFFLTGLVSKWGVGATFWGNYHSRKLWVPRSNTGGNEGLADEYAPGRTTLNLNLFKRFHHGMEAFVRLENLLDETNVKYGYWPGFQVFAGFTYGINKEL